jgi:hypothetical protein
MKTFLGLASVVFLLLGCSNPANREIRACQDFFSVEPLTIVAEVHLEEVLEVAERHQGTSIGSQVAEYASALQIWTEYFETEFYKSDNWLESEESVININLAERAKDLGARLTIRCDNFLTG